jgi:hypothetical protein
MSNNPEVKMGKAKSLSKAALCFFVVNNMSTFALYAWE